MPRYREPQLQVGEKWFFFILKTKCKYWCSLLRAHIAVTQKNILRFLLLSLLDKWRHIKIDSTLTYGWYDVICFVLFLFLPLIHYSAFFFHATIQPVSPQIIPDLNAMHCAISICTHTNTCFSIAPHSRHHGNNRMKMTPFMYRHLVSARNIHDVIVRRKNTNPDGKPGCVNNQIICPRGSNIQLVWSKPHQQRDS